MATRREISDAARGEAIKVARRGLVDWKPERMNHGIALALLNAAADVMRELDQDTRHYAALQELITGTEMAGSLAGSSADDHLHASDAWNALAEIAVEAAEDAENTAQSILDDHANMLESYSCHG